MDYRLLGGAVALFLIVLFGGSFRAPPVDSTTEQHRLELLARTLQPQQPFAQVGSSPYSLLLGGHHTSSGPIQLPAPVTAGGGAGKASRWGAPPGEEGVLPTPWTEEVNRTKPLPEYPRPQMRRKQWENLNGKWEFETSRQVVWATRAAPLPLLDWWCKPAVG